MTDPTFLMVLIIIEVWGVLHSISQSFYLLNFDSMHVNRAHDMWEFQLVYFILGNIVPFIMMIFVYKIFITLGQSLQSETDICDRDHKQYQNIYRLQTLHVFISLVRLIMFMIIGYIFMCDLFFDDYQMGLNKNIRADEKHYYIKHGLSKIGFISILNFEWILCQKRDIMNLYHRQGINEISESTHLCMYTSRIFGLVLIIPFILVQIYFSYTMLLIRNNIN